MRTALKWVGIILGGLAGLLILVAIALLVYGQVSFKRTVSNRPLYPITADTSPEGLARGKYLIEQAMDCTNACHTPENGQPLTGTYENINFGPISGVFAVPNLTPDQETGLGSWTDAEIARAIREGLDKYGVELVIMPSYNYHVLSDADIAAIIGYLRSLDPVHNEIPPQVNAVGKVMSALGMLGEKSRRTDHSSAKHAGAGHAGVWEVHCCSGGMQ
jgi:mono/diheme cytochrome c family protein